MSYWRLSAFYLFFFGSIGVMIPYWTLYLKSLGLGAAEIGELTAVVMATKIIAPNIWGWLADYTGKRVFIIRLAGFASVVCFAGVFIAQDYWWLVLVMTVFSFFWNAALPQFEATTMTHLGENAHRYSSIRLWGSVGFIVAVVLVGELLDDIGTEVVPAAIMLSLIGAWGATLLVSQKKETTAKRGDNGPITRVLRRPEVIIVLLVCFLLQASHGPYYTFFTIYLEETGYSRGAIGWLWALGVVAEIVVFLFMHRLLPKYGARTLLLLALALTTLRWLMIAWGVESVMIILLAQLAHAASFGIYHAVAIHLIHKFFVGSHQGRGQALYSSLSFGAGGAAGSLASGYLWESVGSGFTFSFAAVLSLFAWLLTRFFIKSSD